MVELNWTYYSCLSYHNFFPTLFVEDCLPRTHVTGLKQKTDDLTQFLSESPNFHYFAHGSGMQKYAVITMNIECKTEYF